MSRTIRRRKGNQWFSYNSRREYNNNPYWGRSCLGSRRVVATKTIQTYPYWCFIDQCYKYREHEVEISDFKRIPQDDPRTEKEMKQLKHDSIDWESRMRRDGLSDTPKLETLKRENNRLRRSDLKRELNRISSIADVEDMNFIDSKRKENRLIHF